MTPGIPLRYNLRNLAVRRVTTALTAIGMGLVVFALSWVLALAEGLRSSLARSASPENVIVIRPTATAEANSSVSREAARLLGDLPQVARGHGGTPLVSGELLVQAMLPRRTGGRVNAILRGIDPVAFEVHDRVRVVRGRAPRPGTGESIAGLALAREIASVELGATVSVARTPRKIVGIFEADGSALESELWTDARTLMDDFRREHFSTVNLKLARPADFPAFASAVEANPRIALRAWREEDYYADQARAADFTRNVGLVAALIMAVGAVLGAMNTMYSAVAGRAREVGTLMAIGFRPLHVLLSFMTESAIIGLAGGLLGILPALLFHGRSVAMVNFRSFSEVQFSLAVTPQVFLTALGFALGMGLLGGILPSWRAARLTPVEALREL